MRRHPLAAIATLVFGCSLEQVVLEAELPEDVAYVAVVELDERGQVLRGSPLRRRVAGQPFGVAAARDGEVLLMGYTEAQLAAFEPERRFDLVQRSPLRRAEGCAPRLPEPRWVARWTDEHKLEASEDESPPVTTDFAVGVCPELSGLEVAVDRRCTQTRCTAETQRLAECTLSVDLEACGSSRAEVVIDAFGRACGQWIGESSACVERASSEPAFARLECSGAPPCEYELHLGAQDLGGRFELETVRLFDAPRFVHSALRQNVLPLPRANLRGSGYILDLLVRDGQVLLASPDLREPWQECAGDWRVRLSRYDAGSLTLVETGTVARCLMRMVGDPEGSGFLGVHRVAGGWHLGRFGPEGELISTVAADPRVEPEPGGPVMLAFGDFHPTELVLVDAGRYAAVLYARRVETDLTPPQSIVLVHDAETLQVAARHDLPPGEDPRSMTGQGDRLVLLSPRSRSIIWLHALSGERVQELPVGRESFGLQSFTSVGTHRGEALLLAGLTGGERAVLAIEAEPRVERMVNFDRDLDTFAAAEVPGANSVFLTGGISQTKDGEWVAVLGLVEPDRRRALAGSMVVGAGLVSHVVPDGAGRLLALLPWEPSLVRLSPRVRAR